MPKFIPTPVYINHKDGAELIKVHPDDLRQLVDRRLIFKCKRKGHGFVYKISDLLLLADSIDKGETEIFINYKKAA